MRKFLLLLIVPICVTSAVYAQEKNRESYKANKEKKLKEKSPFSQIIDRESFGTIVYEDKYVIAFSGLKNQAPVHYLVVPKKRIATVNEVTEKDAVMLGHLFIAARELAKKFGISETGYRLTVNTNQDAGQSVFHLHMHFMGGEPLPPTSIFEYKPKITPISVPESTLMKYVGVYQFPYKGHDSNAKAFTMVVTKEKEQLYYQIFGQSKVQLLAETENRFVGKTIDTQVQFNDSTAKPTLIYIQGGQQKTAVKLIEMQE